VDDKAVPPTRWEVFFREDSSEGLPHVWLFSEVMFGEVTTSFSMIEKCRVRDIGCTGSHDYVVWRGFFRL
jgi:hypothetical protein